jgi:hypothetical protein
MDIALGRGAVAEEGQNGLTFRGSLVLIPALLVQG